MRRRAGREREQGSETAVVVMGVVGIVRGSMRRRMCMTRTREKM